MAERNAASMGAYGAEWQCAGYVGKGNVAGLLESCSGKPAIVAGGAVNVFDEVVYAEEFVLARDEKPLIFAANDVGMFLPHVDHWCSLHVDNLGAWRSVRWLHPMGGDTKYHSIDKRPFIDYVWQNLTPCFALSGYFAMQIAWLMGCSRIILCGCPGSVGRRFFDTQLRTDFSYDDKGVRTQVEREIARMPQFRAAVRSMSGWTRDFFGGLD